MEKEEEKEEVIIILISPTRPDSLIKEEDLDIKKILVITIIDNKSIIINDN